MVEWKLGRKYTSRISKHQKSKTANSGTSKARTRRGENNYDPSKHVLVVRNNKGRMEHRQT